MQRIQQPARVLSLLLAASLVLSAAAPAVSQAKKAATRSSEFDLFGGLSFVDANYTPPDSNDTPPYSNYGVTAGADYTKFIPRYKGLIIPSFELRGTVTPGSSVGEKTFEAGFRLASTYRRLHPYADLLVGVGVVTFNHPKPVTIGRQYRRDGGFIYVYGGGLMYDVSPNLSALVDYQQQYWNLGQHPPIRFYPGALTFGVVYHIPFKAYKTR